MGLNIKIETLIKGFVYNSGYRAEKVYCPTFLAVRKEMKKDVEDFNKFKEDSQKV